MSLKRYAVSLVSVLKPRALVCASLVRDTEERACLLLLCLPCRHVPDVSLPLQSMKFWRVWLELRREQHVD